MILLEKNKSQAIGKGGVWHSATGKEDTLKGAKRSRLSQRTGVKRYDTTGSAVSRAAGIDSPVEKHLPAVHKVQSSIPGTSDVPVDSSLFNPSGSCDGGSVLLSVYAMYVACIIYVCFPSRLWQLIAS